MDMNLYHIKALPRRRNLDIVRGTIDKQRLKDKDLYSAQGAGQTWIEGAWGPKHREYARYSTWNA